MTREQLSADLAAYGAGLEAEISLLRQLESLAGRERAASESDALELVNALDRERIRLMEGLLEVEHGIKPLRPLLTAHRGEAEGLPGFADVVALHNTARRLVTTILAADQETLRILHEARDARGAALRALEQGGQTLSAYRRVIAPPHHSPALFVGEG